MTECVDARAEVRKHVDLVLFDLDNTLVPVVLQLSAAMAVLQEYMSRRMPQTSAVLLARTHQAMKRCVFGGVMDMSGLFNS